MLEPGVPAAWEFGLDSDWVLVSPAKGQSLYRLVGRSDARLRDFQSDRDKGRPRFPGQSYVDYLGVSMYETEELAQEHATQYPKLIAPVELSAGKGFTLARTEADIDGHYSIWGEAQALLDSVGPVRRHDEPG